MTSRIAVDLIVFDLDGTLADTLPDGNRGRQFCLPPPGAAGTLPGSHPGDDRRGERKLIERLVGPGHQDRVEECLQLYSDHYTRHNGS